MGAIKKFVADESGVTAAEYGIILGSIAAILVIGLLAFYTQLGGVFQGWADWFSTKKTPPSS